MWVQNFRSPSNPIHLLWLVICGSLWHYETTSRSLYHKKTSKPLVAIWCYMHLWCRFWVCQTLSIQSAFVCQKYKLDFRQGLTHVLIVLSLALLSGGECFMKKQEIWKEKGIICKNVKGTNYHLKHSTWLDFLKLQVTRWWGDLGKCYMASSTDSNR